MAGSIVAEDTYLIWVQVFSSFIKICSYASIPGLQTKNCFWCPNFSIRDWKLNLHHHLVTLRIKSLFWFCRNWLCSYLLKNKVHSFYIHSTMILWLGIWPWTHYFQSPHSQGTYKLAINRFSFFTKWSSKPWFLKHQDGEEAQEGEDMCIYTQHTCMN